MKIKEYIIKLKSNKKYYYATIVGLVLLIGVTFAYVIDQISGGAISKVFITADTADSLEFVVDKDISIKPTQFNFVNGGEDLSDTATATARLKANSTNSKATYKYYVYFYIEKNEYIYTTTDHKPEMILQVTDPNGARVTSISGLTYNSSLQGFDITEIDGIIPIAKGHEITSNSSTSFIEQNWIFTIKFINLDSNQTDNGGKTLEGKILIQRDVIKTFDITVSNLATSAGSLASFDCPDATAVYNYKYNELQISNLNDYSKFKNCNLNFSPRTEKQLLNEKIISLETETASRTDWKLVHETFTDASGNTVDTGYRYEGKEPENYIWFNNELWRIIGVFGEGIHGQAGEQLVKIIRNESISNGIYFTSDYAYFPNTELYKVLNPISNLEESGFYYNRINGTNSSVCTAKSCDFRTIGLTNDYRSMIKKVNWKIPNTSVYGDINTIFNGEKDSGNNAIFYIGLMYASDYGYSVLSNGCARTTRLYDYGTYSCAGRSWLLPDNDNEALITRSDSRPIIIGGYYGSASGNYFKNQIINIRPVLYLDANVYIIEGTGTITDPYVIGM